MKMTIVLLVVLGIVAGICAVVLVSAVQSKGLFSGGGRDIAVVMAARNLPKGTRLTADDVTMGTVKQHELSSDRYMSNLALVVNRTLSEDVVKGGVLMANYLETGGSIPDLISRLEPGMRAVSVSLASSQVTGGLLYPGCVVDVLASFQLRGGYGSKDSKGEAVSTTLLERVEVLAIEGQLEDIKDEEKGSSRAARSARTVTVTLKLDTKQAEALQLAAANGEISVSIRSPLDKMAIDPNPTVLNRGKLTRRGMLIDPIVRGQAGGEMQPGIGTALDPEPSSAWEVTVIRGANVEDTEIKVKGEEIKAAE
ncbi:MAG: Flp pilus assembly protein CpaB [Phycisphaerae bacterium]|nr:Flp pilus assembly protein CpaB [Phycisphaerae bacterium]